jgi:restriction endonuclease Mrr
MADAAERVLREHAPGAPMHYRRITELCLAEGLIVSNGVTPEASMVAAVTTEIKRRAVADQEQRFVAAGRGFYALAMPSDPLDGAILRNNDEVRQRLRSSLAELDPRQFETLMGQLLDALGFEDVVVTKYTGDGGIDLRARLAVGGVTDVRTAVQVKRWSANVSGRVIRELRGGLGPHERGLVITLSDFTRDARAEAQATDRSPISLVNGNALMELLVDKEIGVTRRRVTILELDEASLLPSVEEAPDGATFVDEAVRGTAVPSRGSVPPAPPVAPGRARAKALSVWPLPGGSRLWKQTLDEMLTYVAQHGTTLRAGIDWMLERFDRVNSTKVVRGYWQVPRSFGLLETVGARMALTPEGASYLESKSSSQLLEILRASVAGFDEVLRALDQGPVRPDELLPRLNQQLHVQWQSEAQVRFRLGWLENLGVAEQSGGTWWKVAEPDEPAAPAGPGGS